LLPITLSDAPLIMEHVMHPVWEPTTAPKVMGLLFLNRAPRPSSSVDCSG